MMPSAYSSEILPLLSKNALRFTAYGSPVNDFPFALNESCPSTWASALVSAPVSSKKNLSVSVIVESTVIGNEQAPVRTLVKDDVLCTTTGPSAAATGAKTAATRTTTTVVNRFISPHLLSQP